MRPAASSPPKFEYSQRQPRGDTGISLRRSHFLRDLDLCNVNFRGDMNDQIYLAAGEASTAEELLDLVRRAQDFNYGAQIGFPVQFGSIFNNVANNRFNR